MEQFEQMIDFAEDIAMQKKWNAFVRKINMKTDHFDTVLKTINVFLKKPFAAAMENKTFNEQWIATENKWIKPF